MIVKPWTFAPGKQQLLLIQSVTDIPLIELLNKIMIYLAARPV